MNSHLRLLAIALLTIGLTSCSSSTNTDPYTQAKVNFTEQNYHDAYQQLLVPAAQGNPDAEYALGFLYYYGKGTAVNHTLGKQWILKALRDGNTQAAQAYQMIVSREQGIMPVAANPAPKIYHPHLFNKTKRSVKSRVKVLHHSKLHIKSERIKKTNLTTAEHLLLAIRPSDFTLQLFAATTPAFAKQFIQQHKLGKHARYFHRRLNGKSFYAVVYGTYRHRAAAASAITKLPSSARQLHPWVRTISSVQQEIRLAN